MFSCSLGHQNLPSEAWWVTTGRAAHLYVVMLLVKGYVFIIAQLMSFPTSLQAGISALLMR